MASEKKKENLPRLRTLIWVNCWRLGFVPEVQFGECKIGLESFDAGAPMECAFMGLC